MSSEDIKKRQEARSLSISEGAAPELPGQSTIKERAAARDRRVGGPSQTNTGLTAMQARGSAPAPEPEQPEPQPEPEQPAPEPQPEPEPEEEEAAYSYEDYSVEELRDMSRERDLQVSGNKADLIERLQAYDDAD